MPKGLKQAFLFPLFCHTEMPYPYQMHPQTVIHFFSDIVPNLALLEVQSCTTSIVIPLESF